MKHVFRFLLSAILLLGFSQILSAQAREVMVDYKKDKVPGIQRDFDFPPESFEQAIREKMAKFGVDIKKERGYYVAKKVRHPDLGEGEYDLFFSVDQKSRREKDKSTVTMLVKEHGRDHFIAGGSLPAMATRSKTFMNGMHNDAVVAHHNRGVMLEEKEIIEQERKLRRLTEQQKNMQRKLEQLQQEILDNQKQQEQLTKQIQDRRAQVEERKKKGPDIPEIGN